MSFSLAHVISLFVCAALAPTDRSTIGFHYQATCFIVAIALPALVQWSVLIYGVPGLPERTVFLDKVRLGGVAAYSSATPL